MFPTADLIGQSRQKYYETGLEVLPVCTVAMAIEIVYKNCKWF